MPDHCSTSPATGPSVHRSRARGAHVRRVVLLSALLIMMPLRFCSTPRGDADGADVERIIRYLSDDRLEGRGSFTAGNEEAARFIAREFTSAGLRPPSGSDSLLDPFPVTRISQESVSVVLNGRAVPPDEAIVSTELPGGTWTLSDSFPALRMGETFDRAMFRRKNCILLVPRMHEKMFTRYRQYLGRPRVYDGDPAPGTLVAVLTDSQAAASCVITLRGRTERPLLRNVVGTIPGRRAGEFVLFTAHYDHLGIIGAVNGDSIANGADDDASGTTAMIELAKYFSGQGTPERTLVFAALAAEEIGGFGARHLLRNMDPDSIVAMVNIEMVGVVSKFGPRTFWLTGYDRSSLGPLMAKELEGSGFSIYPDPYPAENLFFRSDNAVFARTGVPAHTISTDPIDVDSVYHTVDDEVDRLDIPHLAEIIGGIARGIRGVVDGRDTPTRITIE